MKLYTINDLNQGSGVFDHIMRTGREYPSHHSEMPGAVGIGFMAAAMKSGLTNKQISDVVTCYFDETTAEMLDRLRQMYMGEDQRIHLWNIDNKGNTSVNHSLGWYSNPRWRIERPLAAFQYP